MLVKELPNTKKQIEEILNYLCRNDIDGLNKHDLINDRTTIPEIKDFLDKYLANQNNLLVKFEPPPVDHIDDSVIRPGWSESDMLVDIDLWGNGQATDATAILRIEITDDSTIVKLHDVRVL